MTLPLLLALSALFVGLITLVVVYFAHLPPRHRLGSRRLHETDKPSRVTGLTDCSCGHPRWDHLQGLFECGGEVTEPTFVNGLKLTERVVKCPCWRWEPV